MVSLSLIIFIFSLSPLGTSLLYAWSEKDLAKKESLCRQAGEKSKEVEAYKKKAAGFRGEATSAQEALEGKINEYNKKKRELDKLNTEAKRLDKQITQMQDYGNTYVGDTGIDDKNAEPGMTGAKNLIQKARATNYTPTFIWACKMRECLYKKEESCPDQIPTVPTACKGMENLQKTDIPSLKGKPADPVEDGVLGAKIKPKGWVPKDLKEPFNLEGLGEKIRQNKKDREEIKAEMDKIAKEEVPPLIKKNKDSVAAAEGAMNDAAKALEEAQNKSRDAYALTNTECGVNPPDYSAEAKALEEETEALLDIVQDELKKFKAM